MTHATINTATRRHTTVGTFVASKISTWQRDYLRRRAEALATLARLRRGVGKEVGAMPELWQHTLEGVPGAEPRDDDAPTREERAAYTALTLFAVHQQSRNQEMHQPGQSLGTAVRQLRLRAPSADAVRRRFEALGTSETFPEVVHHARGLITQLRTHNIPLDYGAFAEDLLLLQGRAANQVRLRWGRDFYRNQKADSAYNARTDSPVADAALTNEEAP